MTPSDQSLVKMIKSQKKQTAKITSQLAKQANKPAKQASNPSQTSQQPKPNMEAH